MGHCDLNIDFVNARMAVLTSRFQYTLPVFKQGLLLLASMY